MHAILRLTPMVTACDIQDWLSQMFSLRYDPFLNIHDGSLYIERTRVFTDPVPKIDKYGLVTFCVSKDYLHPVCQRIEAGYAADLRIRGEYANAANFEKARPPDVNLQNKVWDAMRRKFKARGDETRIKLLDGSTPLIADLFEARKAITLPPDSRYGGNPEPRFPYSPYGRDEVRKALGLPAYL